MQATIQKQKSGREIEKRPQRRRIKGQPSSNRINLQFRGTTVPIVKGIALREVLKLARPKFYAYVCGG